MSVSGTPQALAIFRESLRKKNLQGKQVHFSFHQTVPLPEEQKKNWYEWSYANWGTKWDAYDVDEVSFFEKEIQISFTTAWCPPIEWVRGVCKAIPGLIIDLRYDEPNCDLFGDIYCDGVTYTDTPLECTEE